MLQYIMHVEGTDRSVLRIGDNDTVDLTLLQNVDSLGHKLVLHHSYAALPSDAADGDGVEVLHGVPVKEAPEVTVCEHAEQRSVIAGDSGHA